MMRVVMGRARPATEWSDNILSDIQFSPSTLPVTVSMIAQEAAVVTVPDIEVEPAHHNEADSETSTSGSKV
jgi:hypothetical protein